MLKGSQNLLIVGSGRGLGSSHNAIWWNLAIFLQVHVENRPFKRRLYRSLVKSLVAHNMINTVLTLSPLNYNVIKCLSAELINFLIKNSNY